MYGGSAAKLAAAPSDANTIVTASGVLFLVLPAGHVVSEEEEVQVQLVGTVLVVCRCSLASRPPRAVTANAEELKQGGIKGSRS